MTEALLKLLKKPLTISIAEKDRDSMASDVSASLNASYIIAISMVENGELSQTDPRVISVNTMLAQIDFAHDYLDYRLGQPSYETKAPPTTKDLADRIQALICCSGSPEQAASLIRAAIDRVDESIEKCVVAKGEAHVAARVEAGRT